MRPFDKQLVGRRIQHARIERRLSQRELVERSGVKQPRLSMVEHGLHAPNAAVIMALAQALEVSADYLLGLSDTMEPEESEAVPAALDLVEAPA